MKAQQLFACKIWCSFVLVKQQVVGWKKKNENKKNCMVLNATRFTLNSVKRCCSIKCMTRAHLPAKTFSLIRIYHECVALLRLDRTNATGNKKSLFRLETFNTLCIEQAFNQHFLPSFLLCDFSSTLRRFNSPHTLIHIPYKCLAIHSSIRRKRMEW